MVNPRLEIIFPYSVLLDADYNALQIYETARPAVEALLTKPGSMAGKEHQGKTDLGRTSAIEIFSLSLSNA
ncbi:hypothetical protein [Pseudomonas sp. BBP2017]|uniref:hypothetical protein n=1 Tax=Pseudomonas sp. BBP2017 TaxID=2109731 RepID=UPI000D1275E4|nr:hypothetical protein [Pseudomonas sp. BBP2017]PSS45017.1 hypothetical protein C6382_23625 [Pseudomonas sp. BBP2017]